MANPLVRTFQVTALAGAMLAAGTAAAAPGHATHASARHQDRSGEAFYAWVDVVDVDPIVRTRYIEEPVERCYDTRVDRRHDDRRYRDDHARYDARYEDRRYRDDRDRRGQANPGAVLIGGALGGLIGNQFGGGNGKKALTVAGAVIGASIGASASASNNARRYGSHRDSRYDSRGYDSRGYDSRGYDSREDRWRSEPVRRCEVSYESRPVERIEGYEVTYRYHGRRFTKVVDEHPGNRLRVRVDVQPIA